MLRSVFRDPARIALALIVLGFLSMLPNLHLFEYRGIEEAMRTEVAFEMLQSHDWLQPTFWGRAYYKKPPLFTWLVAAYGGVFGLSELTGRLVSVSFVALTTWLIFGYARRLLQDRVAALIAALMYLSCLDILFWYGFWGEIEAAFAFFVFLVFYCQHRALLDGARRWFWLAGVVAGLAFLTKGLPGWVFFGLGWIALAVSRRRWRLLLHPHLLGSGLVALAIPLLWLALTDDPMAAARTLLSETTEKAARAGEGETFFSHLLGYPLLNFKQLLPASLLVVGGLIAYRRRLPLAMPPPVRDILWYVGLNYLPYLLSADARGRYLVPLFPALVVAMAWTVEALDQRRLRAVFYTLVGLLVVGRFVYALVLIPHHMDKPNTYRKAAEAIDRQVGREAILACDCESAREKAVCLYLGLWHGEPLKGPQLTPGWRYLVECHKEPAPGRILQQHRPEKRPIRLLQRE